MASKNPNQVGRALETNTKRPGYAEELQFDPQSGDLIVLNKGERSNDDRVPATEMAREGFFLDF